MQHRSFSIFATILKILAGAFGLCCAAWGLMIGVVGKWYEGIPPWGWRAFGIYVIIAGLLYLIPNRAFNTDRQVRYYMGFTLTNSLVLFLFLAYYLVLSWSMVEDRFSGLIMLITLVPATLLAPVSLALHLIGARKKAIE
jgi:hypothetical protein